MDEIINRILTIAKEKNIRKKQICEVCGINPTNFAQWSNGESLSYRKHIVEIADLLGVSVTYLVTGKESPAESFYTKYQNASEKTRKMIDLLLEEDSTLS